MCMIIYSENGTIPANINQIASDNPDGYGIVDLTNGDIHKGLDVESGVKTLQTMAGRPYIAHFRWASVGSISKGNLHPVHITGSYYLMQNGTAPNHGTKNKSDTCAIASLLKAIPIDLWEDVLLLNTSRFAVIDIKSCEVSLIGQWVEEKDGNVYSKSNAPAVSAYKNWLYDDDDNFIGASDNYDAYGAELLSDDTQGGGLWDDIADCPYIAVYGTLKQGKGNHTLMDGLSYIGKAETLHSYCLNVSGCPYLFESPACGRVQVEIYAVDDIADLQRIDDLEGHPMWYERRIVPMLFDDGNVADCWIYVQPGEGNPEKHIGNY